MQPFPHHYRVDAAAGSEGSVTLSAKDLPALVTAPPVEFDGPGDQWSPEALLVAAAVDCFVLTFRAVAAASKLEWESLACSGEGVVDRIEGTTRFSGMALSARLMLPEGGDADRARRLLEKAERACLVTNSLAVQPTLTCDVEVG